MIIESNFEGIALPAEPVKLGLGLSLLLRPREVTAFLYDLKRGKCLGKASAENAQTVLFPGTESLSEEEYEELLIGFSAGDTEKALWLTSLLREEVYDMTDALAKEAGRSALDVHYITIAGTTLMEHLYAAMPTMTLSGPEGVPLSSFGEEIIAEPVMYYFPVASKKEGGLKAAEALGEKYPFEGQEPSERGVCLSLSQRYRKEIV